MDERLTFTGRIRLWDDTKDGGLAVIDIPAEHVAALGGRRQMRVAGTIGGAPFAGSTMLVKGGGFCVSVRRDAMAAAQVGLGDTVKVELRRAP
jgi:hypothetical protein